MFKNGLDCKGSWRMGRATQWGQGQPGQHRVFSDGLCGTVSSRQIRATQGNQGGTGQHMVFKDSLGYTGSSRTDWTAQRIQGHIMSSRPTWEFSNGLDCTVSSRPVWVSQWIQGRLWPHKEFKDAWPPQGVKCQTEPHSKFKRSLGLTGLSRSNCPAQGVLRWTRPHNHFGRLGYIASSRTYWSAQHSRTDRTTHWTQGQAVVYWETLSQNRGDRSHLVTPPYPKNKANILFLDNPTTDIHRKLAALALGRSAA
jgi:hypothetical protein